jgi:shikimate kinase
MQRSWGSFETSRGLRLPRGLPVGRASGFVPAMASQDVNLYIVGFMGTGKTTIGRAVAQRLQMNFLDSDHEIERVAGRKITEIFATSGEAEFRRMEREFVESGHPARGCVVACGGGLIIPEGMLAAVSARGVILCLHASIATIIDRVSRNRSRPLLDVEDAVTEATQLYAKREPIYRRAGTTLLTDGRSIADTVQHVQRIYRREAREWERTHR